MTNTILAESTAPVNHTLIKASDGSILVGESPLEVLTWLARTSDRVKGFATYSQSVVKFFGGAVKEVEVSEETYKAFEAHLKATDWQLRPQVTSGGFTATRIN